MTCLSLTIALALGRHLLRRESTSDLKENLSFLQSKIESAREQADVQTISNVEYSKGVDTLAQSNSDSDEEEILLAAPIPVKTRKVLW